MVSGQQEFLFSETCWEGNFVPHLNALLNIFFPAHLFAGFFFLKKGPSKFFSTKCVYLYIVAILVMNLIWS